MHTRGSGGERERNWLPAAAYGMVIIALIALVVTPALMVRRVSRVTETIRLVVLPTDHALRDFAFAAERRSAATRGLAITGDPVFRRQLDASELAAIAALDSLEQLVPRIGGTAVAHVDSLRTYVERRDALEDSIVAAGSDFATYQAAFPRLEALRDSVLAQVTGLQRDLTIITDARLADEAEWAERQVTLTILLGVLALLAALLVGWFMILQRRLRRDVQTALAVANRARAEADKRHVQLERVTESRTRLMRGFSHDLKNPLGAATGYLSLLEDELMGPLTEKQHGGIRRARASINAALQLVEDLLEIARAESGKLEVVPAPTDLRKVVVEAAEAYRAQAESKGLGFDVQIDNDIAPISTDARRVRQVLANLISNAVKYTREGGVTVRLDNGRPAPILNGKRPVAITVADTGPGVPPDKKDLVFEEFVRLDPSAGGGLGIGLTISHRVAEALGGTISVDSQPGEGTAFTLWLPDR